MTQIKTLTDIANEYLSQLDIIQLTAQRVTHYQKLLEEAYKQREKLIEELGKSLSKDQSSLLVPAANGKYVCVRRVMDTEHRTAEVLELAT